MPFPPTKLSDDLESNLEDFVRNYDFTKLYKEYNWGADTWQNDFPKILKLEIKITRAAKNSSVKKEDILSVAKWGKYRGVQRIKCPETLALALPLYENGCPHKKIEKDPLIPLRVLQAKSEGLDPTYLSKVLRFALPSEFGAVDTRIIRVVGIGDPVSKQQSWLSLKVRNDGYGWYIPMNQSAWPKEYFKWINILRFFTHFLNSSGTLCPHPEGFSRNDLRTQGIWACSDVEMALFSYASKFSTQRSATSDDTGHTAALSLCRKRRSGGRGMATRRYAPLSRSWEMRRCSYRIGSM